MHCNRSMCLYLILKVETNMVGPHPYLSLQITDPLILSQTHLASALAYARLCRHHPSKSCIHHLLTVFSVPSYVAALSPLAPIPPSWTHTQQA